eukprot:gene15523-18437_t
MSKKSKDAPGFGLNAPMPVLENGVFYPLKQLNEKQLEIYNQFRSNLADVTDPEHKAFMTDMCLLRYLRARNFNIPKAEKLLRDTLEWRKTYRPQDVKLDDVASMARTGAIYVHGKDKRGRPIIVARPRRDTQKNVPSEQKFKHLVYWLEEGFRRMDETKGIEQFCFIVDYKGFSRKNMDMKTTLDCMHHLLDHCVERMGQSLFLDVPVVFHMAWKVISPFLNEVTMAKVRFVNSKKVNGKRVFPELLDYVSADQLETDFGGENQYEFNLPGVTMITETNKDGNHSDEEDEEVDIRVSNLYICPCVSMMNDLNTLNQHLPMRGT